MPGKPCQFSLLLTFLLIIACSANAQQMPLLQVSANHHFFQMADGKPFFWLGDTGWLLFSKTTRQEAVHYLETRKEQGFNVVQVMVLHDVAAKNVYGRSALNEGNVTQPIFVKEGETDPDNYWAHLEFIVQEAARRGIYIGLVPVWGGEVKARKVTAEQATIYARFLVKQFSKYPNIIWINGGDIKGTDGLDVWEAIGKTLRKEDSKHLVTFHPRGRYSSSEWFQQDAWLDFNLFQSGHRTYAQDTSRADKNHYGEDNWRYIQQDYSLKPTKPTLDGEPSYENIPYGLHDSLNPRWSAAEVRRYGYWSVFAGGAGFTYGENAVMQFHKKGDADYNYGVNDTWMNTIHAAGATQMHYLKDLMLSKPYFERMPAQEIIADNNEPKYNYLLATKGKNYAFIYTYTGRNFSVDASKLGFKLHSAQWFSPATGMKTNAIFTKQGSLWMFNPPGEPENGNDWVLILD